MLEALYQELRVPAAPIAGLACDTELQPRGPFGPLI